MSAFRRLGGSVATLAVTAAAVLAGPATALALTTLWDAQRDFSAATNPNGAWSYGWSAGRGSAFNPYTVAATTGVFNVWKYSANQLEPGIIYNGTATTAAYASGLIPPGSLAFHPGPSGQNAIVRWTAPSAGSYDVVATFTGRDQVGPTTTDVAVLSNGTQLWAGEVTGYLAAQTFTSGPLKLNTGDTIDFTVGFGTDGNYYYDTTGLAARVSVSDPPAVSITTPAQGSTYTINRSVIAAYACTSPALSPVTCVGTVPNGSRIDTASAGSKTFTVAASDLASNSTTKSVTYTVAYGICWLYDPARKETESIKLSVCDAQGVDLSSPSITVTAVSVTQLATGAQVPLSSGENARLGNQFQFDPELGAGGGYIYHLGAEHLAAGTYALTFTVLGDPSSHTASFNVVGDHGLQSAATDREDKNLLFG